MSTQPELLLSKEDHDRAFTEVSFLLDMLVRTAGTVVGKSTPALGVNAGRHMGKKLPVLITEPNMEKVLAATADALKSGFVVKCSAIDSGARVEFGRCAIREVCRDRGLEVGGDLCKMFHAYVAGMMAQLLGKPVRPGQTTAGDTCSVQFDAQK